MEIKKLDRDRLTLDYGMPAQRLLPWPALNAPFEGGWFVVRPGTASTPHAHPEYEIFVAVSGEAELECDGVRSRFTAGDVAHFQPGTTHQVINDGDTDFELYAIWWDAALAQRFTARDEERVS